MLTNFNIWLYCSYENLQPNDKLLYYNIQFVYEYYRIEKQRRFCMLSMLPLRLAIVAVSCSFFKVCSLSAVPTLYLEIP